MKAITREEKIMSGENLTPITRKEMFLAKAAGQNVQTPTPITREEMFLSEIVGGGSGSTEEWIGDGNTHLWISLPEGRTSPMLGIGVNGTVTVDWGDGTEPDILTGTNVSTAVWTPNHEYGKAGDYIITLTVDGEAGFVGDSAADRRSCLRYSSDGDSRNYVYQNALKKAEVGSGVTTIDKHAFCDCWSLSSVIIPDSVTTIGDYAFQACYGLSSVVIGSGVTTIGMYAFAYCHHLSSVVIPDSVTTLSTQVFTNCYNLSSVVIGSGVTAIGPSNFTNCYNLSSVVIPDSVTTIGQAAFQSSRSLSFVVIPAGVKTIYAKAFSNCGGVIGYDFTNHRKVPTLGNTEVFQNLSADCEILVPAALYDEWIAATNWTTYASYIKAV